VNRQTVFGDLKALATAVYRVQTQSSVYLLGIHDAGERRYVIVRGEPGSDRENVVVRDSDPRIGDQSLFDVPVGEWVGRELEVATMTSSTIVSVTPEQVAGAIDIERSPWARPVAVAVPDEPFVAPRPPGMPINPRIVPAPARGTHPAGASVAHIAKQVVVGKAPAAVAEAEAEAPAEYPERHVLYAENIAALLRSLARRERVYDDVSPAQRERLRKSLDDAAILLEQIRRRDRK
jgi:hypothetical protein